MTLFVHSGRSVILTEEGKIFLPYAEKMIDVYHSGIHKVAQWKQGFSRSITLAVHPYIASYILPRFLPRYIKENPDVEISTIVAESDDIKTAVEENQADIGLSRKDPNSDSLYYEHICEGTFCLAVPSQQNSPCDADAILGRCRLLTHDHPSGDSLMAMIRLQYPHVQTMSVGQIDAAVNMIKAGIGVSFLPTYIIKHDQYGLMPIETPHLELSASQTYMIWKRNSEHIKQFHAMLCEFLKQEQM